VSEINPAVFAVKLWHFFFGEIFLDEIIEIYRICCLGRYFFPKIISNASALMIYYSLKENYWQSSDYKKMNELSPPGPNQEPIQMLPEHAVNKMTLGSENPAFT
jgi:hypothetical protein